MSAAYKLLGQGDGGTSAIQAILDETGLARRAFYRHFASKDDLIISMYRVENERVAVALKSAIAAASTPPEALEAWIDHWMTIIYDPGRVRHVRVLSSPEAHKIAGLRAVQQESYDVAIGALAEVLERGLAEGDFPRAEPFPDARAIHASVIALLNARLQHAYTPTMRDARAHLCRLVNRVAGVPTTR